MYWPIIQIITFTSQYFMVLSRSPQFNVDPCFCDDDHNIFLSVFSPRDKNSVTGHMPTHYFFSTLTIKTQDRNGFLFVIFLFLFLRIKFLIKKLDLNIIIMREIETDWRKKTLVLFILTSLAWPNASDPFRRWTPASP